MGRHDFDGYQEDIVRCGRIYGGFKGSEPIVRAVCSAISESLSDEPSPIVPVIDVDESAEQMRTGNTLGLEPDLEARAIVGLLKRMNAAILKANPQLKAVVQALTDCYDRFLSDCSPLIGRKEVNDLRDRVVAEGTLEQDLATFLFSLALSALYRQQLASSREVLPINLWEGGLCPLCGEKPHFGMLRPEDGAKTLECWLCGTQWVHPRIKCPFCDNEEQEDLGYFTAEGNDACRVNFCRDCSSYYKVFDVRQFGVGSGLSLTIHNLATLNYDLAARQEGFRAGSGLNWVNEGDLALEPPGELPKS